MNDPAVSVVIPVFNRRQHLEEAVGSVEAQTFASWELIVVDDGSTDDTAEALGSIAGRGHRVLRRANGGCGAARNTGIAAARGRFVAFLDSDDLWPAGKLERQVAVLEAEPGVDHVFGVQEYFTDEPEIAHLAGQRHAAYLASAVLTRRGSFARIGPMPEVRMGEFLRWMTLSRAAGLRERMLDEVVVHRRVHRGNSVRDEARFAASRMEFVKDRLRGVRSRRPAV